MAPPAKPPTVEEILTNDIVPQLRELVAQVKVNSAATLFGEMMRIQASRMNCSPEELDGLSITELNKITTLSNQAAVSAILLLRNLFGPQVLPP